MSQEGSVIGLRAVWLTVCGMRVNREMGDQRWKTPEDYQSGAKRVGETPNRSPKGKGSFGTGVAAPSLSGMETPLRSHDVHVNVLTGRGEGYRHATLTPNPMLDRIV